MATCWFDLCRKRTGRTRAAHAFELSRCLYIGGKFKQNFWKKSNGNLGPNLDHDLTIWCQLFFYQNKLCEHCLHFIRLYMKMLTNREMVNFQLSDFLRFFFIF